MMIVNQEQALTGTGLHSSQRIVCKIGVEQSVIDYETLSQLET